MFEEVAGIEGHSNASPQQIRPTSTNPSLLNDVSEFEVRDNETNTTGHRRQKFHEDVCHAFMACDVPLNNVNKELMKIFV